MTTTTPVPTAAFMRQVHDAVRYSYEGGQLPDDLPDDVAAFCDGDGGTLRAVELAIRLLEERESGAVLPAFPRLTAVPDAS